MDVARKPCRLKISAETVSTRARCASARVVVVTHNRVLSTDWSVEYREPANELGTERRTARLPRRLQSVRGPRDPAAGAGGGGHQDLPARPDEAHGRRGTARP